MFGITMGDASGVGPEIVLKAYPRLAKNTIVIGDFDVLVYCSEVLGYTVPLRRLEDSGDLEPGCLNVLDAGLLKREDISIGKISAKSGAAALMYVEMGTRMALQGKIDAIVTMPMNKEATRLSHEHFVGHTEFIANMCGTTDYTMMLISDQLIVTHVSTHVSLRQAIELAKTERIHKVIRLTNVAVQRLRSRHRIAVASLNPHAGEQGSFGSEEVAEILPAIQMATKDGIDVAGPVAPDTVFFRAVKGHFDAVVCMYHDQGHIPMKLLDFDRGVNVTLGLPIVRTSVDHGTAFDIAYRGVASETSLIRACEVAEKLVEAELSWEID